MEINIKIDTGEEPKVEVKEKCKECGKHKCECGKVKRKKRKLKNGEETILELPNQTETETAKGNNNILSMLGL